jgi:hypothetical protein
MKAFQFHRRKTRRWWYGGISTVVAALFAVFYIAGAGAVLNGSPSSFESGDGNQTVELTHDWANVSFDHVVDVASDNSDDSFVSGQKQDTVCPDTYTHGNPPKDDFTDVASYSETNTDSSSSQFKHTFLYGATLRYTSNGTASENVELKQGTSGFCAGSTTLLARTPGDKLLAFDYSGGGSKVDLHVLTWIAPDDPTTPINESTLGGNNGTCFVSNDPLPCWGANVLHPSASSFEGTASTDPISSANDPIGNAADSSDSTKFSFYKGKTVPAGAFAEFGVDLAATDIIPTGTCKAFPQTVWESRSSTSFVSTTKDISIENHTISNCGELIIIKRTAPNRGINHDFKYNSTIPNPTGTVTSDSSPYCQQDTLPNGTYGTGDLGFKLNDNGNTTTDSAANTEDCKNLATGTYTVTEQSDPDYTLSNIVCTVSGPNGSTGNVGVLVNGAFANGGNNTFDTGDNTIQANVNAGDVITCVYTNTLNQGALVIKKLSTKTGNPLVQVAGATFCYRTATGCTSATGTNVTDTTDGTGGDSDNTIGQICVPNLTPGAYKVNETGAPAGYGIGTSGEQTVTVVTGTNCTTNKPGSGATATFTDPPLSKIEVKFFRVGTQTETSASIVCKDAGNTVIPASPNEEGSPDPAFDDTDETFGNGTSTLVPGTYTCTVVIDP